MKGATGGKRRNHRSVAVADTLRPPAQHGAGADAAVRPEDRSDFESWDQPIAFPIYQCGAAQRQAVGWR
jgi:hypothetical protein